MHSFFTKQIKQVQNLGIFLITIPGVGRFQTKKILRLGGFLFYTRTSTLTSYQTMAFFKWLEQYILNQTRIGFQLNLQIKKDIQKKISKKTFQGLKFIAHLPVRGQRTKTNANTARKLNRI